VSSPTPAYGFGHALIAVAILWTMYATPVVLLVALLVWLL
jgi:hypothetical protein